MKIAMERLYCQLQLPGTSPGKRPDSNKPFWQSDKHLIKSDKQHSPLLT